MEIAWIMQNPWSLSDTCLNYLDFVWKKDTIYIIHLQFNYLFPWKTCFPTMVYVLWLKVQRMLAIWPINSVDWFSRGIDLLRKRVMEINCWFLPMKAYLESHPKCVCMNVYIYQFSGIGLLTVNHIYTYVCVYTHTFW